MNTYQRIISFSMLIIVVVTYTANAEPTEQILDYLGKKF